MSIVQTLKWELRARLDDAGKLSLLRTLPRGARVLDVGCGNHSVSLYKGFRCHLRYVGIDVADYNLTTSDKNLMEEYVTCPASGFAERIRAFRGDFDAVISSHNLEHCDDPAAVIEAMAQVVKSGGYLHLSFPSEASIRFPSRGGTLNFHDDPTHRTLLPYDELVAGLSARGFRMRRTVRRNRGVLWIPFLFGALQEPLSVLRGKVMSYTWHFWGFESVIVAQKV